MLDPSASLVPRLDAMRALVEEVAIPLEPRFLQAGWGAVAEGLAAGREEARRRGLWTPHLPVALGGWGLGLFDLAFVCEQLGRSIFGPYLVNLQAPDVGNTELLLEQATAEQRERFLLPLVAGQIRSCFAMTEPDRAGSNPTWLDTTAREDGDSWVLDGRKWFTSSAEGAAFAVVMAVTDPEAPPHRRASMLLVPTDTPGYRLVRNLPVMGEVGGGWASHAEVAFEGCRVPRSALLGPRGAGFELAQARLGPGRIHHCMRWLGISARAFDLLCDRAAGRELAPGDRLASRQLVQAWIAESAAEMAAARGLVLATAAKIERAGARAARLDISLIKFYTAGVLERVLDRAIQVHGGLGVTDLTPLAWWFRHERAARIYDGADEVHKTAAARAILKARGVELRGHG
jgi:acyl-CoA dehydrogenase